MTRWRAMVLIIGGLLMVAGNLSSLTRPTPNKVINYVPTAADAEDRRRLIG